MKLLLVALSLLASYVLPAQNTATKNATCKQNHIAATPAETAFAQNNYKKAAELFASEIAAAPTEDRLRAAQIRNLIANEDIGEASKQITTFVEARPDSAYAMNSLAEMMMRSGRLPESYAEAAKAQKADPCNPWTYQTLYRYETMIAMHATAKRHIDLAHALDPMDAEITEQ